MSRLEGETRNSELKNIPSWEFKSGNKINDCVFKKFQFKDFVTAFGFMTQIALLSEKVNIFLINSLLK